MTPFLVWLVFAGWQLTAQPSQQVGMIQGVVVKLGTTEPLPGTRVGLVKDGATSLSGSTTSGPDGTFRFSDVQAGVYRVLATRSDGYLPAEYGQPRPNVRGQTITISPGLATAVIQLPMASPASITGRVLDHDGDPVGHAQVVALKAIYDRDGYRTQTIAQSVQTNDLGEYRLFWLPPAQYYLTARPEDVNARGVQAYIRPPDNQAIHEETSAPVLQHHVTESGDILEEVSVPVYFPGVFDAQSATIMTVRIGDNIQGADFSLPEMPPARRIRGTVMDATTGQPITSGSVRAMLRVAGPNITLAASSLNSKGEFEIAGVVAGAYNVYAIPGASSGFLGGRSAKVAVDVGAKDLDNVSIVVPPPFLISGTISVEGKAEVDATKLRISLQPDPNIAGIPFPQPTVQMGLPDPNAVSSDGTFTLPIIGSGDYKLNVIYPVPGLVTYVKSIRLDNADILLEGLHLAKQPQGQMEIVIGTVVGEATGTVMTDAQEPVPNSAITLVPENPLRPRKDLYRTATSDASGHFTMRGIPPGDYKLFAWDEIERGSWLDPTFLRDFEGRGTTIHIGGGSTDAVQLTIIKTR